MKNRKRKWVFISVIPLVVACFETFIPLKDLVKRLIGLPGDTIEIIDKELFVNGMQFKENYIIHVDEHIYPSGAKSRDNLGPIKVPDDHFSLWVTIVTNALTADFGGLLKYPKLKDG